MHHNLQRAMSTLPVKRLRGVVFDMDGTLTVPNLDFTDMYRRCNVPLDQDLLAAIAAMPFEEASKANAVIDEMEEEGRRTLQLEPGAAMFAKWLQYHHIPTAIVTRNTSKTVQHLHAKLWVSKGLPAFHPAISRDDPPGLPAKPDPAAMALIANDWNVSDLGEILMVGDSPSNDVVFGKAAGTATALVDSGRRYMEEQGGKADGQHGADFRVDHLALLPHLLWKKYEIGTGLGTSHKCPTPTMPTTEFERAAFEGDLPTLQHMILNDPEGLQKHHAREVEDGTNSALVWASDRGNVDCVETLARMDGVDLDRKGYLGATALSRAARKGHVDILELLLGLGADPNIGNDKLQYPLHIAAFHNQTDAVRVLLKFHADTYVLDRKGRTPAEDTKDQQIREAILRVR